MKTPAHNIVEALACHGIQINIWGPLYNTRYECTAGPRISVNGKQSEDLPSWHGYDLNSPEVSDSVMPALTKIVRKLVNSGVNDPALTAALL